MKKNEPRILLWDIETAPHRVRTWGKYDQNALWVDEYGHLLSVAWKWLGEKTTHVLGLDDFDLYDTDPCDDSILMDEIWLLLDEADVLIGHNGKNFDTRKAIGRMIAMNYDQGPSPFKEIDTKLMAKKAGFFFSNSLNDLADEMRIGRKVQTGGIDLWHRIEVDRDPKAFAHMKLYNKHDVDLLEQVYLRLRPWSKTGVNLATMADRPDACPSCLSDSGMLESKGFNYTAVSRRRRYRCRSCGANCSGRNIERLGTKYVA
jgi:RNase_H superfamily